MSFDHRLEPASQIGVRSVGSRLPSSPLIPAEPGLPARCREEAQWPQEACVAAWGQFCGLKKNEGENYKAQSHPYHLGTPARLQGHRMEVLDSRARRPVVLQPHLLARSDASGWRWGQKKGRALAFSEHLLCARAGAVPGTMHHPRHTSVSFVSVASCSATETKSQ